MQVHLLRTHKVHKMGTFAKSAPRDCARILSSARPAQWVDLHIPTIALRLLEVYAPMHHTQAARGQLQTY